VLLHPFRRFLFVTRFIWNLVASACNEALIREQLAPSVEEAVLLMDRVPIMSAG
jgi:hypothetical protein